jgi:glucose-1-phosphate cytidylyltransferase
MELPKPLLEVGGRPVLRHVMEVYAAQGWREFVLAAGYRHALIEDFAASLPPAWDVQVVDTGEETGTGERVAKCRHLLGGTFFLTYGDGLGDVELADLVAFHTAHGGPATLTSVPLRSQYGTIEWDGNGQVRRFREKPELRDHWINAGFFVMDERAFEHWSGDDLERDVLPALSAAGELFAYRHHGFWKSMDTYKDALELSALCEGGGAPWQWRPSAT